MEGKYLRCFLFLCRFLKLDNAMSYQGGIGDVNTNCEAVTWNI